MPQGETKAADVRALDLYTQIVEREQKIKLILIKATDAEKKAYTEAKESFLKEFNA